jgi:hypothetical protein
LNCPNCGKPVRDGAAFCGECGFKLATAVVDVTPAAAPPVEQPLRRPPPPPTSAEAPLLRPPPPPPAAPEVPEVPEVVVPPVVVPETVVPEPAMPDVQPVLVVPPPPPGVPKEVEVVPFGTTEDVVLPLSEVAPTITITAPPPGPSDPAPEAATPAAAVVTPTPESMDETRVSVRRRAGAHGRLVLPDARHVEVLTALLVGRDPSANANWPGAALLTIDDDAHSVSKTHAVFEVDAEGLWVTDLNSTNGVVITQPDGTELDLDPNVRGSIHPGADVELGDYIIQVEKD